MEPQTDIDRKLAAILAADIVGFSAIAEADQFGALAMLRALRDGVIKPAISRHGGRLFKELGDGFLAEFGDAEAAVLAAAQIQRELHGAQPAWNGKVPVLRIGLHAGSVFVEGSDLLGDTVNVANRAQAFAPPGGLCLTGAVYEQVSHSVDLSFRPLGPRHFKNISRAVTLFEVAGPDLGDEPRKRSGVRQARPPLIAVMPFENLGGAKDIGYLCDGIAIELVAALSRFHSVRVLSSATSFAFRDSRSGTSDMARALGADYVLQGSMLSRKAGLRLVVSLTDGETGANCWAETYDCANEEFLGVHDNLAAAIAGMLESRVFRSRLSRIERSPAETVAAYDCWLRGHVLLSRWTAEADERGLAWFERAILQDSSFARAHASLASVLNTRNMLQPGYPNVAEDLARAMKHSRLAIELDDADARNHVNHAWGLMIGRDFAAAGRHFALAEKLNPNAADILISLALGAAFLGDRGKARALAGRAFDLNPLYEDVYLANLAMIRFLADEFEEAAETGGEVRAALPEMSGWVAAALGRLGRTEEANAEARGFLGVVALRWRGPEPPRPDAVVGWFLSINPIKSKASLAALLQGLDAAGLPVSGRLP